MRFTFVVLLTFVFTFLTGAYLVFYPVQIDGTKTVNVPSGQSVQKTGEVLKEENIIRSSSMFALLVRIQSPKGITAGTYEFSGSVNLGSVSMRIISGQRGINQIRITIPEGFTNKEIIARLKANFPNFNTNILEQNLKNTEGSIFPETYFFDSGSTENDVTNMLITKGNTKIEKILGSDIDENLRKTILIKASLIEAEGRNKDERYMIAGVIENRLKINMPLQLDATLTYLTGRGSSQLTVQDLKMDSPYNTYVNKGLPPNPINNPGEESIVAAMKPKANDYLFYLHAPNGQIHYAKTFNEHVKNKNKYLK